MVHANVNELITEQVPHIEFVNRRCLRQAGSFYKEKARKVKTDLLNFGKSAAAGQVGTLMGDKLLAEAEEDEEYQIKQIMDKLQAMERKIEMEDDWDE